MKISWGLVLCMKLIAVNSYCQKKIIDEAACKEWKRLEEINGKSCLLSADGNWIMFRTYSESEGTATILKNLKLSTEKRYPAAHSENSFEGSNFFSFQLPGDSLVIFNTHKATYAYLSGVKGYFIISSTIANRIAYFTTESGKNLLRIWDINNKGEIMELPDVERSGYWVNNQGTILITKSPKGLTYTNLQNLKQSLVPFGANTESVAFSENGNEIAYVTREADGCQLKYFDTHSGIATLLVNDLTDSLKDSWKLEPTGLSFGNNDGNIFFKISRAPSYYERQQEDVITHDVDVWSHHDIYLQPKQLSELHRTIVFTNMINVRDKKIIQVESNELSLWILGNTSRYLVLTNTVNENEFYWNKEKMNIVLFSAITGEKTLVKESLYPDSYIIGVSPDNRFLVWFDGDELNYYSYNMITGKTSKISGSIDGSLSAFNQRGTAPKSINRRFPCGPQYWINNGSALLVHGRNDIWQLDPAGVRDPINLTNGYGSSRNIRFALVKSEIPMLESAPLSLNNNDFLVSAFDYRSKQNGFWRISSGKSADPTKLIMSDHAYLFNHMSTITPASSGEDPTKFQPVKAAKSNLFVFRRMSASQAPNLYYTSDFKNSKQISNINPNKDYVWMSTKLITYTAPDGQQAEGILHLPDNLDTTKKYPVIFNYYERRSETLNVFRIPKLSGHNINIPWYISRGYLVFEPDFYYVKGKTAQSVIQSVETGAAELRKFSYVDENKMGVQGQSHGGYETNIIATGTNIFAAACEMAGYTNIISEYGSVRPNGFNNQIAADLLQRNLAVFPWEHPEVFIESSPVFHVDKMSTPLLMVHNKDDGAVAFSQAIELYLAARRLKKKVWLLQYDKEGHTINNDDNKLDFTIRMQQFFDHYLKDAPMPVWMSKGIPAKMKGVVSGFGYEAVNEDLKK